MSSVFIGMPVYNGEKFIGNAIESILNQTFSDWELLISDNASEDNTSHICMKYCCVDKRIHYVRQNDNMGAANNFKFVLENATGEYFMWAAADDEWNKEFIAACVISLKKNPQIGMSFSNIVNIDSFGRIIREYPSFEVFAGISSKDTVIRYLKSPEFFGKANLIYSLYKVDICRKAWNAYPITDDWGSDMCFVLGALARGGLCVDRRVLFKKRLVREMDTPDRMEKIIIKNPYDDSFGFLQSFTYIKNNLKAVQGTPYYWITLAILLGKLPKSFVAFCMSPVYYISRKFSGF